MLYEAPMDRVYTTRIVIQHFHRLNSWNEVVIREAYSPDSRGPTEQDGHPGIA